MVSRAADLIFATTEDERSHHFLRPRHSLLGQQGNLMVAFDLEDRTQRVKRVRKTLRQDEVHQGLEIGVRQRSVYVSFHLPPTLANYFEAAFQ
jgi:hypothetical protein